ncbi:hypothetical protein AAFF_G00153000 [Aldrovandia affinis]|uniref:Uncharacterized protein n=1 Tax=Aldrovandia affinis TaxID=143900 RepID=A0AAD7RNS7_9TELE|nr:hypothetical protein AAFF_G00153000 [Aldrovandia affinis]
MEERSKGGEESTERMHLSQRRRQENLEEEEEEKDYEERKRREKEEEWSTFMPISVTLALLGAFMLGMRAALEHTEGSQGESNTPKHQNPGPWGCVVFVLNTTAKGGSSGLFIGVAAMTVVWIAETLSASKGLVATVTPIPPMGLLIGAGAGAMEGVGRVPELLEPGVFWEAVSGGMRGAEMGARVAVIGGVVIGGAMCALAAMAVKNLIMGAELRVAPLMTVSVAVGASRMVLSLAPESMAIGAFVGSVLGAARDLRVLGALGMVGVGGCLGMRCLGCAPANMSKGARLITRLLGGLTGAGGAVILIIFLGFPLRLLSALVSAPVGAAIAILVWRVGELVCQSVAEVVEKLFGAISINTHYSRDETER